MFEESMIVSGGKLKATKAWLTFPASVLLHGFAILAVIIAPLLQADANLPEIKVIDVLGCVKTKAQDKASKHSNCLAVTLFSEPLWQNCASKGYE